MQIHTQLGNEKNKPVTGAWHCRCSRNNPRFFIVSLHFNFMKIIWSIIICNFAANSHAAVQVMRACLE
jgi:hypothetical protein